MTAFSGRRFSVFANQSKTIDEECTRIGHTEPDAKGRCYRCGQRVAFGVARASDLLTAGSCTEKEHRFNGDEAACACGTTRRMTPREEVHAR